MRTAVELLKPHTHAGTDYPAGAVLSVPAETGPDSLTSRDADWLVEMGSARWVKDPAAAPAAPKNPPPAPKPAAD